MNYRADSESDQMRQALRGTASTVSIVTTADSGVKHGMVATAVISLSLEPPMLGVAINRSASIHDPISRSRAYCVNFLADGDEAISRKFSKLKGEDRFSVGQWLPASDPEFLGIPFLNSAQAAIFCAVESEVSCGSHTFYIGGLRKVFRGTGIEPLVYCNASFGRFRPSVSSLAISGGASAGSAV